MTFEKLKVGDVYYDVHSYRMGNTTIRSMGVWTVKVLSLNPASETAVVSWNGNRSETYYRNDWKKLRVKQPEMETNAFGAQRLKPRAPKKGKRT